MTETLNFWPERACDTTMSRYTAVIPNEVTVDQVTDNPSVLVPINDRSAGGVVAYALPDHAETIVDRLNRRR